jgi:hypothetical protein
MMIRTDILPDTTTLGEKRIFVVASRPVTVGGKTIRHVLIFDNHPASLRLLLSSNVIPQRRNEFFHAVLAIALVLAGWSWDVLAFALSESARPARSSGCQDRDLGLLQESSSRRQVFALRDRA